MWIDLNDCEIKFHEIVKQDGEWIALHPDGSECDECEFNVSELTEAA